MSSIQEVSSDNVGEVVDILSHEESAPPDSMNENLETVGASSEPKPANGPECSQAGQCLPSLTEAELLQETIRNFESALPTSECWESAAREDTVENDEAIFGDLRPTLAQVLRYYATLSNTPVNNMDLFLHLVHTLKPKGVELAGLPRTGQGLMQVITITMFIYAYLCLAIMC